MEKFGIFNLLSALAGAAAHEEERAPQDDPPPPPQAGMFTPEQRAARCLRLLERHEHIARGIDKKHR